MFMKRDLQYFSSNLNGYIEGLDAGELRMIPKIFCVFSERSRKHKNKAARVLVTFLKNASFDQIARVDAQMRQTTSMEWSIDWRTKTIKDFVTLKMSREEVRAVVIFSSFNPNGYIRQKAMEQLCSYESTLPYMMLRLNDWVQEVRQSAFDSFSKRLKVASKQELLLSIPLLEKLRRSTRCEYADIPNLFDQVINNCSNKHIIENGLYDQDPKIRKYCCRILLHSPETNVQILRQYVVQEKVPYLRKTVFESLIEANVDVVNLADVFLADKFPATRYLALQYLYKAGKEDIFRKAQSLLTDRNSNIRELARMILREINRSFDLLEFYMGKVSANPTVAILGLGEVGSPAICGTIEKHLNSDKISVIRASMISLMRLNAPLYGRVILELLSSEHAGIVKIAKNLIEKHATYDYPRIFEIYQYTPYENTKMKCAALLFSAGKWQRMIYIMRILSEKSVRLQALCLSELSQWFDSYNRSYTLATKEQKAILRDLMDINMDRLSEHSRSQLLFILNQQCDSSI